MSPLFLLRCSTCGRISLDVLASAMCWRCLTVRVALIGKASLPADSTGDES